MHLQPSSPGRRTRGGPSQNLVKTVIDHLPRQPAAKQFIALVKPAIENIVRAHPYLAYCTLQVRGTKDRANPDLTLQLRCNPKPEHWDAITHHLTLWLIVLARAPLASVAIRRECTRAGYDVFLVTVSLTGEAS